VSRPATRSITSGTPSRCPGEFRDSAKDEADLDPIRDEPVFKQLISE
jgi:hypothetical protein